MPTDPMTVQKVNCPRGFTIVELLIVISIISFIAALLLPALSNAKNRGRGADWINRLKQCGVGSRVFSNDNDEAFPWQIEVGKGGSLGSIDWTDHVRALSNELVTPKILASPLDRERAEYDDWTTLDGDKHVSTFVGLEAQESKSQSILFGDRTVHGGGGGAEPFWTASVLTSVDAAWDDTINKGRKGYIVLSDGSVHHMSTAQLREQIAAAIANGCKQVTFSLPRGIP
jgi:prepilin-type N-terminal cleavage/methylation domain-containing protein